MYPRVCSECKCMDCKKYDDCTDSVGEDPFQCGKITCDDYED